MALKTNYVDSVYTQKVYEKSVGSDGYYRFRDSTEYDVIGDYYGANDINAQNSEYNRISSNFDIINTLIDKIITAQTEVDDNDIESILTAIQTCAEATRTNAYNDGVEEYVAAVKANPGMDNLVDQQLVDDVDSVITSNQVQIEAALVRIDEIVPLHSKPNEPTVSFTTDPVNASEVNSIKTTLNDYANTTHNYCTQYNTTASYNMNTAKGLLEYVHACQLPTV